MRIIHGGVYWQGHIVKVEMSQRKETGDHTSIALDGLLLSELGEYKNTRTPEMNVPHSALYSSTRAIIKKSVFRCTSILVMHTLKKPTYS